MGNTTSGNAAFPTVKSRINIKIKLNTMNQKASEKTLIKSLFLKIRRPITSGIMVIIPIKRRNSSESRDKEKRKRRLPKEIPAIFLISLFSSII
jgi:hypothetical protein